MHTIIGISGLAGAGKDTVGDYLVKEHACIKIALADPLKRICKEVYDFSDEQLWGGSKHRNLPDERHPREHSWKRTSAVERVEQGEFWNCPCCGQTKEGFGSNKDNVTSCSLTPRYALQLLGTEWGRQCRENTWVDLAIRTSKKLLGGLSSYTAQAGVLPRHDGTRAPQAIVISDVRFKNEMAAIRAAGGEIWRVRPGQPGDPLPKAAFDHPSETEQLTIPDDQFDRVIFNQKVAFEVLYESIENCLKI